ncbi:MAG TPA: glycoside hydrolase family 3 N-terminal domain-containing protein [Aggregatilineaceae bacterium]|nr:glycoside hydrolase family 3 N-terminal domain-containing protein [Aggregatilineaceae bacterium]
MTLEEKIAQLGSCWVYELLDGMAFAPEKAQKLLHNGLGQITRIGGASSLRPAESAALANEVQKFLIENTRLGIPAVVHEECCSGYMAHSATCFPQIIGTASTWEPDLVEQMAGIISAQMRAVGAHQGLSPVLDVARDARWGRVEETFGEDPYLVAALGSAYVRGLQQGDLTRGVMATGKHFLGYSVSEGGLNWAPARIPPRELYEVFLFPFEAAIRTEKLASIMNGYHELDGVPMASAREMLTDLLRGDLGFDGIVVSDYFAVNQLNSYHQAARDKSEAAVMSLEAGIDVELPGTDCYGTPLRKAIEGGALSMDTLDEAVRRALRMKFLTGVFDQPYVEASRAMEVFDTPAQRDVARRVAQRSLVLLRNEGDLLPLARDLGTIAVIGPNADSKRNLIGDYAYPCHVESLLEMKDKNVFSIPVPTLDAATDLVDNFVPMRSIRQAIQDKLQGGKVLYALGCDTLDESREGFAESVRIARQAQVAVVVVGDKSGLAKGCTTGESCDRAELDLPGVQGELVQAIVETGTPTVVVLTNGRPVAIPWIVDHVPAILEAWLPGEEGANAVADVLFGDCNPGGKLPITFPRSAGQIPIYYAHKPTGGRSMWKGDYVEMSSKPLYPFGYGLSYTSFAYSDLHISPAQVPVDGEVTIALKVRNSGQRCGDEVVQLYVHDALSSCTRPVKELKGFKRITLEAGEQKTLTFTLAVRQLGFLNRHMQFVVEPGTIEVMIGSSSADTRLTGEFEITGTVTEIGSQKVYFSRVS